MKRFLPLFAVLLWVAACGATPEKYPYPPQFVSPNAQTLAILPPPAAKDSDSYKASLEAVLLAQKDITEPLKAIIIEEDHITPMMMVTPVLGEQVTPESFPALYRLLRHAGSDTWRITDAIQERWKVDRPWVADARVKLYAPRITRPSYPSGHTSTNHMWAWVLSDLMPCQKKAFFERANAIAFHRVTGGVHFPTDVEAGKMLSQTLYQEMRKHPAFQAEQAAARAELKAALGAKSFQ